MRSPLRPLPAPVERWTTLVRVLRWLDALAAGLVAWGALALAFPSAPRLPLAALACLIVALGTLVRPVRALAAAERHRRARAERPALARRSGLVRAAGPRRARPRDGASPDARSHRAPER